MQDRPDVGELLEAVRAFLEGQVVPALDGTRRFHARVAANVLAIVGRELAQEATLLRAEWTRLGELLGVSAARVPDSDAALRAAVRELNGVLAARIREGAADDGPWGAAVLAHLRATTAERLAIANPRYAEPRLVE